MKGPTSKRATPRPRKGLRSPPSPRASREPPGTASPSEMQQLREQLELERQHLEAESSMLARAQSELDAAQEAHVELFDVAPVGYLILNRNGIVLNANLTAAAMLGWERENLI